ncbi:MAG: hypothetical protein HKP61_08635 [Dactylosporangium sp.]|nr:hypothetical protein [Dactylosporangium sp.]NNJ61001.1 hypothetical protein [Dactylosporangium sp.]
MGYLTRAAILLGLLFASTLPAPASASPWPPAESPPRTQICDGAGTGTGERAIDTLMVRLNLTRGVLRGYWVQYSDEASFAGRATLVTAQPFFVALPPDAADNPDAYVYHLPYRENYGFDAEPLTASETTAQPFVQTYRDVPDRVISTGSTFTVLGQIYGATGTFSTCQFTWSR